MDSSLHWKDKSKTSPVIPDLIWNLLWGAKIPLWIPVYTGMANQNTPCHSRLDLESTVGSNNTLMDSSLHWKDKSKTSPVIPDLIWNPPWGTIITLMDSSLHWKDKSKTNLVIPDLIWNLLWGATIPLWIPAYAGRTRKRQSKGQY